MGLCVCDCQSEEGGGWGVRNGREKEGLCSYLPQSEPPIRKDDDSNLILKKYKTPPPLHPLFLRHLAAPYAPRLPTILGYVRTWVDMWGWKEDGDAGGTKDNKAAGNV
ncbi:hypothetical protein ILYODFUR_014656 [Ilyodon furcidens]|uniref:Uncharacterized protein n=1 Tax=Ilyodon furcidens TaxID=33524 RepID=A0ABV0V327_9TELE